MLPSLKRFIVWAICLAIWSVVVVLLHYRSDTNLLLMGFIWGVCFAGLADSAFAFIRVYSQERK
jgi:hypothetical protein